MRGVVFAWDHPVYGVLISDDSGVSELNLVDAIPSGPSPGSVVLTDLTEHRRVPAKVTPVPLDQAPLGEAKFYLPRDPTLRACIRKSLRVDGRTCLSRTRAAGLLAAGRLRDVTTLVAERRGNYFIAPMKGFSAGHVYAIRRDSRPEIWRFPDRTQVVIDQSALAPASASQVMLVSTWQATVGTTTTIGVPWFPSVCAKPGSVIARR